MPVTLRALSRIRLAALLPVVLLIAACAPPPEVSRLPVTDPLPGYEAVQDGDILIPEVRPGYTTEHNRRTRVTWTGVEGPGTIVVDPWARWLYYVEEGGTAIRYGIAVGREGRGFRGNAVISRKEEWPFWRPTDNMIRTEPEHYAQFAAGVEGGLDNPLGARALYLYRGGRDTKYRIHGTNASQTIGRRTSAGCIRMFNQDAIDLYLRASLGTSVIVRTPEESLAIEGAFVELANGYIVPEGSPEALEYYNSQSVAAAEYSDVFSQIN